MIEELIEKAAELADCDPEEVEWYSWPQVFSNTAGPQGGVGGQMLTTFQVYAFNACGKYMKYCNGVWRHWDGQFLQRW